MTESTTAAVHAFAEAVSTRLAKLEELAANGGFDAAIDLIEQALRNGGVAYAFGTGHSEAFAMEIAGRAGGLVPTKKVALRDLALVGDLPVSELKGASLERNPDVADRLFEIAQVGPHDVVLIASNSGVNGSIVGFALAAKRAGNPVIAV
ncbi:MAG: SIS domain-containing protein, partial [Amnibacterium sp.]